MGTKKSNREDDKLIEYKGHKPEKKKTGNVSKVETKSKSKKQKNKKDPMEFHKKLLWTIVLNGLAMMWGSYILAWYDKTQIAESLSTNVSNTIMGVIIPYLITKVVENVSKYGCRVNRTTKEFDNMVMKTIEDAKEVASNTVENTKELMGNLADPFISEEENNECTI